MDARIHREWNFNRNSSYDADIAVLTLFKTLEFSDSIQPVCVSPNGGDIVVQGGVFVSNFPCSLEQIDNQLLIHIGGLPSS